MVNNAEMTPPPIPDLASLWADFGIKRTTSFPPKKDSTTNDAKGSKAGVSDKLNDVSLDDAKADTSLLKLKLSIMKKVIFFCNEGGQEKYNEIMNDLQNHRVEEFAIDHRLKRALEGKDAANKKYKAGDRIGALYTYAIAWGLLVPYYPEHFPLDSQKGRDYRSELGKAETALFSNMSAMVLMHLKESVETTGTRKESLVQIGIDASEVCMAMKEFVTVGIMVKSCRRAKELGEMIRNKPFTSKLAFYKEQEEKLKGVDEKKMFKDVPAEQHARAVK